MKKDMSGPAFPSNNVVDGQNKLVLGLTKREYFAGLAMQAIIIGNDADIICTGKEGAGGMSKDALNVADALLKELSK